MNDLEKKCYCFVLQCYFGDMADPVNAAIDRAYVDMASHTLKGFAEEEYRQKWKCRYCASETIKKAVQKTEEMRQNYNSWHNKLCNKLQSIYVEKAKYQLTYGQAQKWVNMATKYLLVLRSFSRIWTAKRNWILFRIFSEKLMQFKNYIFLWTVSLCSNTRSTILAHGAR